MAQKALLLKDKETYNKIMSTSNFVEIKEHSKNLNDLDQNDYSDIIRKGYVSLFRSCFFKFPLPHLEEIFIKTGTKKLVFVSPDKILGVGLSSEEVFKIPENEWPGENMVGNLLMELRVLICKKLSS